MTKVGLGLDKLKCPNCGEMIPVSEAISHQIVERTREQLKKEGLAQQQAINAKERELPTAPRFDAVAANAPVGLQGC